MTPAQLKRFRPAATFLERVLYCAFVFHLLFAVLSIALTFVGAEADPRHWRGGVLFTVLALMSWYGARRVRRYKESLA